MHVSSYPFFSFNLLPCAWIWHGNLLSFFVVPEQGGLGGAGLTSVPCISAIATMFYEWGREHGRIRGLEPVFCRVPFLA